MSKELRDLTKDELKREWMKRKCENKRPIHIGDQFILTITGICTDKDGTIYYDCNQFGENSMMSYEELDNMIPVEKDTLCYENGYRVGFKDGYETAQEKDRKYMVDFMCDMFKDRNEPADTEEEDEE